MTPQPRHIELARAIADAENRAAWDGYAHGVQLALHRVESKYGPRPEVG